MISRMALANAQSAAIKKAVSSSKISFPLIAKLALYVAETYTSAHKSLTKLEYDYKDFSINFKKYVEDMEGYSRASVSKFMAAEHYKNR